MPAPNRSILIVIAGLVIALISAGCTEASLPPAFAGLLTPQPLAVTEPTAAPTSTFTPQPTAPTAAPTSPPRTAAAETEGPPDYLGLFQWRTDFSQHSVPWHEFVPGGPRKDGIPAIDNPTFEPVDAAAAWLSDRDPVIVYQQGDEARAYPLAIVVYHEIVNDVFGDQALTVTYCPLCNASIVFDRYLDDLLLDFGTTGNVRKSDLVMYDRQTESWWQQFTGEAIVGQMTGSQLRFLPSQVVSFKDFRERFLAGTVLERPRSSSGHFARMYGSTAYAGYDTSTSPFLFSEVESRRFVELIPDPRLPAFERIAGVILDDQAMAYPFTSVAAVGAINTDFSAQPIVVLHKRGTASAMDRSAISEGRDVGSIGVFVRNLDGQLLTFVAKPGGTFQDQETQSSWNILGEAVAGPLAGSRLEQVIAFDHFWFAWAAFHPETQIYQP